MLPTSKHHRFSPLHLIKRLKWKKKTIPAKPSKTKSAKPGGGGAPWHELPPELLYEIFKYLSDGKSLLVCSQVCVCWRDLLDKYETAFWKPACLEEWKLLQTETHDAVLVATSSWKDAWIKSNDGTGNCMKQAMALIAGHKHCTYLHLDKLSIPALPDVIFTLKRLRRLYLQGNQVTHIPPELSQLSNLWYLNLSFNYISELPMELSTMTKLQAVDLSFNKFTQVPKVMFSWVNLFAVDLDNNHIQEIPEDINTLGHLQYLSMKGNPIRNIHSKFFELPNLKSIRF